MQKRISESKKLEGTGFWGKLHTKDHPVIYLFLGGGGIKLLNKKQVAIYHA
jgi:hypothetical protein